MAKRVMFIGSKQLGIKALKCLYELSPDSLTSAVTIDDADDTRSELHRFREFSSKTNNALYILKKPSDLRKSFRKKSLTFALLFVGTGLSNLTYLRKYLQAL